MVSSVGVHPSNIVVELTRLYLSLILASFFANKYYYSLLLVHVILINLQNKSTQYSVLYLGLLVIYLYLESHSVTPTVVQFFLTFFVHQIDTDNYLRINRSTSEAKCLHLKGSDPVSKFLLTSIIYSSSPPYFSKKITKKIYCLNSYQQLQSAAVLTN